MFKAVKNFATKIVAPLRKLTLTVGLISLSSLAFAKGVKTNTQTKLISKTELLNKTKQGFDDWQKANNLVPKTQAEVANMSPAEYKEWKNTRKTDTDPNLLQEIAENERKIDELQKQIDDCAKRGVDTTAINVLKMQLNDAYARIDSLQNRPAEVIKIKDNTAQFNAYAGLGGADFTKDNLVRVGNGDRPGGMPIEDPNGTILNKTPKPKTIEELDGAYLAFLAGIKAQKELYKQNGIGGRLEVLGLVGDGEVHLEPTVFLYAKLNKVSIGPLVTLRNTQALFGGAFWNELGINKSWSVIDEVRVLQDKLTNGVDLSTQIGILKKFNKDSLFKGVSFNVVGGLATGSDAQGRKGFGADVIGYF